MRSALPPLAGQQWFTIFAITVVIVSLFSTAALADELYARVRGTVTDTSGAVLPGVTLKITNVATGTSKQTTSSAEGSYEFINLISGRYTVSGTKTGFATLTVSDVKLEANQTYVNNISMKVGGVTEEVTVLANPAQVEQTSMQLTATISDKTITDLPLNGRNWITLQQSLPGVVISESRFATNYSTNGSQSQQNSYLINGTDFNDLPLNSPLASPSPDSIAEVRMITNTINPEYGRNSGAIMNAISKSGSNRFHGTAFEFYRDTFLNTKTFFQKTPSIFHQNQYGGTVGGPILKNKTFFFFSLQNTRARQAQAFSTPKVFSNAERGGDFSAVLANISATKTSPFAVTGSNGTVFPAGTPWKTIFPTGIVPVADFNPVSAALLGSMVPVANLGQTFTFNPTTNVASNQYLGRFDQNFGAKDALWFYGFAQNATNSSTLPFTGANVPIPGVGDQSTTFTKQFTASWSHTFSTSVLNELRAGYTRVIFNATSPQKPAPPSSFGFPDINSQLTSGESMPFIGITGYFNLGFSTNGPQPRIDQTYQLTDNLSWVHGRHSFKFGYEGRKFQVWNPFSARNNGSFSFSRTGFYSTGDPGLDFLLGIPASYNQGSGGLIIADAYEHYFYAQDQWRLRNNLTLTYGLGYQIDTPLAEHQFKGISRVCFIPGQQSKIFATAPAGLNYPGDPGCNASGGATTKLGHFGPRVGLAYSPNWGWLSGGPGKLSIRGGFGVYYNRSEEELSLQDLQAPPTGLSSTGIADISTSGLRLVSGFPNPWVDVAGHIVGGFGNKFPFTPPAAGSSPNFSPFLPLSVNTLDSAATVPYAMNWNLTIERELPAQTILRVGYVGSHGANLITAYDRNPVTPAGVTACLTDPACLADPYSQNTNYPTHQQYPGNIFGGIGWERNRGWSNYNALQVTVDKHLTHGLQLLGTYTWSHSLDVSSSYEDTAFVGNGSFDPYGRLQRDYGNSAFDTRHRFTVSTSYDIPNINKLSAFSWMPSRVMGGWRITALNVYQTGQPVILADSNNNSLTCVNHVYYSCADRPDFSGTVAATQLDPHKANFNGAGSYFAFNPNAFTDNALGTLGNVSRGFLHGPGFWNIDFSVQKDTKITESTLVQLRLEAFNLLNHTNFANPSCGTGACDVANLGGPFGQITAIRGNSRLIQLGAKFVF